MAIQMRQGNEVDFDAEKMLPGEWAVSTDAKIVRICFAPGIVARIATYEAFEADMVKIEAILKNVQDIQTAVKLVQAEINGKSELVAENASLAEEYMLKAKEYAEQAGAFTGMQIAKRDLLGVVKGGDMAVEDDGALRNFKRGAGNTFAVSDTVEAPLSDIKLYGKSVQETVPGNQLLDATDLTSAVAGGITFTVLGDGGITINGTTTTYPNINKNISLHSGTYILSHSGSRANLVRIRLINRSDNSTIKDYGNGTPFTFDEDTMFAHFYCQVDSGWTINNETIYPMLNAGTEALPYEPYTGGIPSPNPSFPQPIVSVGEKLAMGKNLLDIPDGEVVINGTLKSVAKNGVVHVSGTPASNTLFVIKGGYNNTTALFTLPIGTYTAHGEVYFHSYDGTNRTVLSSTFTVTEETPITCVFIKHSQNTFEAGTSYDLTIYPMLNSGSTALPWEPYTGGKKAAYDVGIGNDICGVNLFDKNNPTGTSYIDLVGEIHSSTDWSVSNYIHVAPEKSYVLHGLTSHPNSNRDNYSLYDSNKMYIGYKSVNILTDYPISFDDAAYVRFSYKTVESDTIMFNEGEEQPYTPYTGQSHTLSKSITLHGIGDVRDELTPDGVGRKFKKVVFDGSDDEEWEDAKGNAPFGIKISDIKPALNGNLPPNAICTHYIPVSNVADWSQYDYLMSYFGGDFTLIRFRNIGISSLDEWKAELHSNPITVVYELAEPIIEPLSEADQIDLRSLHSYDGVTTVMSDAWAEVECATSNVAALAMYIKRDYVPKAKYDALESRISALEQQIVNA